MHPIQFNGVSLGVVIAIIVLVVAVLGIFAIPLSGPAVLVLIALVALARLT